MAFISLTKSVTFYAGSLAIPVGFVGDLDVTLSPAIDPTRLMNVIPLRVNGTTATGPMTFGHCASGNVGYAHAYVFSATVFRFKTVGNASGAAQTLNYAFLVVEGR